MSDSVALQDWFARRNPPQEEKVAAQASGHPAEVPGKSNGGIKLAEQYKAVVRELLRRPAWKLAELRAITSRIGPMPLACIARINEWAVDTHGEPLLEGDEIITVNEHLKQKIQI